MQPKSLSPTWPVNNFKTVSLSALVMATAAQRVDYKFCVPEVLLESFLTVLSSENFSAVEVKDKTVVSAYQTAYFDDESLTNFHTHRCGKLPRHKFRYRKYKSTGQEFLEKKTKSQGVKTNKVRFIPDKKTNFAIQLQNKFNASILQKSLEVSYERVSFLSADTQIKITVDRFFQVEGRFIMPNFFIVEIKVPRHKTQDFSVLKKFLHLHRIRETSFSKYCVGLCWKHVHLPRNKWKQVFKKYIK